MERKFTISALFYFVFEGKFQVQAPRGAYIRRGDLTEGFLRYHLEGGAYIWRGLFSEFYGILILCKICIFMWQNFIVYSLTCFLYLLVCLTLTCQNEVLVTQSILVEIVILFFLQKNCLDSQVLLRRNNGTFTLSMFLHLVIVLKGNTSFTFPYFFCACNFT